MTGPFAGFSKHEQLSMNALMLFFAIAALLGILALIGTRYGWVRASGRLLLKVVAPILLGIHLNYSWASSGPDHRLPSRSIGLIASWAAAIALWEFTCRLGCNHGSRTAGQDVEGHSAAPHACKQQVH